MQWEKKRSIGSNHANTSFINSMTNNDGDDGDYYYYDNHKLLLFYVMAIN